MLVLIFCHDFCHRFIFVILLYITAQVSINHFWKWNICLFICQYQQWVYINNKLVCNENTCVWVCLWQLNIARNRFLCIKSPWRRPNWSQLWSWYLIIPIFHDDIQPSICVILIIKIGYQTVPFHSHHGNIQSS